MPSVLCIAGLDPSGHAGLSADMRALGFLGIECLPVATALTVQNSRSFSGFLPVPADTLFEQLEAVFAEAKPDAVKIGMLGSLDIADAISEFFEESEIPIVLDPIFVSTTGHELADAEMIEFLKSDLLALSSLVTPNAAEASVLSGMAVNSPEDARQACLRISDLGTRAILVKGGHFTQSRGTDILFDGNDFIEIPGRELDVSVRGTGCTYSSLIAGHMALGKGPVKAVKAAKIELAAALGFAQAVGIEKLSFAEPLSPERHALIDELNMAVYQLPSIMPPDYIAEVGNNIAFALESAAGREDICSLDSRLLLKGGRIVTMGTPVFGRQSHVGRVVLAAMAKDPGMRCAINIRFSEQNLMALSKAGFRVGSFDRSGEPSSSSSMEWGTGKAINDLGYVPDAVFDRGSVGKEPMIRLLARNPEELLDKLARMAESGR